jgi:hypothetical protein
MDIPHKNAYFNAAAKKKAGAAETAGKNEKVIADFGVRRFN